ncbi:MAG: site-specific integrase [Thermoleophilia bacterium]
MAAALEKTSVPGVYRRGGRYVVAYRDPDGKQRRRSARTLAEARALKAELNADVQRGEYREQSRVLFGDYARDWASTYTGRTSRGIRPNTLRDYRDDLEQHVIPVLGGRRLSSIEPRHLKALTLKLAEQGKAPSTVRNIMAPVRALFATAVEEGVLRTNPCLGLRLPGGQAAGARQPRALTEQELTRLMGEVPHQWRLLVGFLTQTGVRVGELTALCWGDVDLESRRVRVRRRRYRNTLDAPKSRFGIRDIPISPALASDLRAHRAASRFPGDEDPVFPTFNGAPQDATNLLARVVKPAAVRAGVPWAGLHTLRHTCASILFRSGWNAKQVQMVLGHHSAAFTLSTYVHLVPDDLPEPVFRDELVGRTPTPPTRHSPADGA